jgi:hypothetical protein
MQDIPLKAFGQPHWIVAEAMYFLQSKPAAIQNAEDSAPAFGSEIKG